MKAINFPARGEVRFASLEDPVAGPGEVTIAVKASGICHTDFEVLAANYGVGAFPVVPGHEFAGLVVDVGPEVAGISTGDRVVVDPNIECGHCRACRRGWAHLCEALRAYGVTQNGGFAELCTVKAAAIHPIGAMTFSDAALAEPMGCVLNGVDAVWSEPMENALIFGAGPMGILMAIALKSKGLDSIGLVDIDQTRLDLVERLGFRPIPAGSADLEQSQHAFDLVVDATGVPAVAGRLTDYMANGGKGLFFGVCPASTRIEIAPFEVFRRQLTLAGSHSLNHNIPAALKIIAGYGAGLELVVSHRLSLEEGAAILSSKPPAGSLKIQAIAD